LVISKKEKKVSRVGKKPVEIPEKVEITLNGNTITVKGPKGTLTREMFEGYSVAVEGKNVIVKPENEGEEHWAKWGLLRVLINNMVVGVSAGYTKGLIIEGTGFRFAVDGTDKMTISAGYSHAVRYIAPKGITFGIEGQNKVTISGIDKQIVGQVAAEIRSIRKPEPYKGKGIRYDNEVIVRKEGKKSGKK
jgi:large subunit ribosomal protein L6